MHLTSRLWNGPVFASLYSIRIIGCARRRLAVAALVAAVAAWAGGCQSPVYDQNVKLREQNRELQARLDERAAMQQQQPPSPVAPPEPIRSPDTAPLAHLPPPPEPVRPPMPPAGDDLRGLDTIEDPVAGTTTVNFVGDALFDPGRATVKDTAHKGLDQVVAALKNKYAGKPVRVQGHTDSDPIKKSGWADNRALSQARADSVKKYLVGHGIDASRITAEGFGDAKPKDPAGTSAAKARNRRVEIVVGTR